MTNDVWLPKGYVLPDGAKIRSLLYSGDNWQIFATSGSSNILLTRPQLAEQWDILGFLNAAVFGRVSFGSELFWSITSDQKYLLEPVTSGKPPESTVDALAFAVALKESRKQSTDVSFHDALYVEQYSRLLPTWTLTPAVDDELVLGGWLTAGVEIPTTSFRRLTHLTGWMPAGELAKIVNAAGLTIPADAGLLERGIPAPRSPIAKRVAAPKTIEAEQECSSKESTAPKAFRLPGRPQLESFFNEHVIDIIYNSERYQALPLSSCMALQGAVKLLRWIASWSLLIGRSIQSIQIRLAVRIFMPQAKRSLKFLIKLLKMHLLFLLLMKWNHFSQIEHWELRQACTASKRLPSSSGASLKQSKRRF